MTKAELIERIARSRNLPPDLSKKDIERILTLAFDEIAGFFVRSKVTRNQNPRFSFPHFGSFIKKRRPSRRGVNPRTLEPMQIDAFCTLDFRPSAELREAMNPSANGDETRRRPRAKASNAGATAKANGSDASEALPAAPLSRVRLGNQRPRTRTVG